MRCYKLAGAVPVGGVGQLSLQVVQTGRVKVVNYSVFPLGCDALNDGFTIEVSTSAVLETASLAVPRSFCTIMFSQQFLTTGGGGGGINGSVPMDYAVGSGDLLQLNTDLEGGCTLSMVQIYIWVA